MMWPISFSLEGFSIRINLLCPVPGTGTGRGTGDGEGTLMFLTGALFIASIVTRLCEGSSCCTRIKATP